MATVGESGARGGLAGVLLGHAYDLTREAGPDAVSLREVQRRAGVSNAAAYRHFRDREALLLAVAQRASAAMADLMDAEIAALPPTGKAAEDAIARLQACGAGYLRFVRTEPGLFRAAFLQPHGNAADPSEPDDEARGRSGLGPYQLLQRCIADLAATGVIAPEDMAFTDTTAWAAVHGLAVLLLDGPLRALSPVDQDAASRRLLGVVSAGITRR